MSQLRSGTLSINQSGIAGFSAKVSQIGEATPPAHSKIFNPDFVADQFTADCTGSATCAGDFSGVKQFTAALTGSASVSASFQGVQLVGASLTGAAAVSASFDGVKILSGAMTGGAAVSGNMGGVKMLSGGMTGSASVSGVFNGGGFVVALSGSGGVSATFTAFNPTPEPGGGGGDYVPNRFDPDKTPWPDKPKKHAPKHVRTKRVHIRTNRVRKSGNDYFHVPESITVSQPLPVARQHPGIAHSPRVQPRFVQTQPGIGRDVMDALMAVMAADGVKPNESPGALPIDDDLELVMLIDEIT